MYHNIAESTVVGIYIKCIMASLSLHLQPRMHNLAWQDEIDQNCGRMKQAINRKRDSSSQDAKHHQEDAEDYLSQLNELRALGNTFFQLEVDRSNEDSGIEVSALGTRLPRYNPLPTTSNDSQWASSISTPSGFCAYVTPPNTRHCRLELSSAVFHSLPLSSTVF